MQQIKSLAVDMVSTEEEAVPCIYIYIYIYTYIYTYI